MLKKIKFFAFCALSQTKMGFQLFLYLLLISGFPNTKLSVHCLTYEKIIEEAKAFPITLEREYIADDHEKRKAKKPNLRGGISDQKLRWHDYRMLIVIDTAYKEEERKKLTAGLFTLAKAMQCFKFILVNRKQRVNLRKDHVYIKKGAPGDCFSRIGRVGEGRQVIEIGERCSLYGTIIHEVMHALGFFHEQVRQDRDQYVKVDYLQFLPPTPEWMIDQYLIRPNQVLFVPQYDFDSIMHYTVGNRFIQALPGKVPPGVTPGQKDHLSTLDVERLNRMYPCSHAPRP